MYVKLFSSILTSSVWSADMPTRLVWITLLAMADREGFVRSSPSGLARVANVSPEDCQKALECFLSPDTESGSKEYEGRRLAAHDGGWEILNYVKYRELQDIETRKAQWREASKEYRQRKSSKRQQPSSARHPESAHTELDADTETEADAKKRVVARLSIDETLRPAEQRFLQMFYAGANPVRLLDIRSQLCQVLTIGAKHNGSLVHAHDTAHLDGVLAQVCDGPAMRDPNLAIVVALKKLAETYLEVKSAAEKSTEIQRSKP